MKLKLTCLLLCLASLSASGSDLASQLLECQKFKDENQRLACFDQISNPKPTVTAPVSLPPPPEVMTPVSPPAPAAPVAATPALPAAPVIERVTELPQETVSPKTATAVTEKVKVEDFGAEQLKKPEPVEAAELSSKVVKTEKDARKRMIFHLANGQQWLQLEVEYFYVKPGDTAIIRRAALGSFLLGTDRVSKKSGSAVSNETLRWFDAGVNLFSAQFDTDRQQVLQNARMAGVQTQLLIGSDLAETALNLAFCQQEAGCLTTAGVHPHQAAAVDENWQAQLQQLLQADKVVAVGECGLDFNRMFSPRDCQIRVFETQLALAKNLQKAVYLHERDAFDTQISLLKNNQICHGIAHCFTGDSHQLKAYLDLGLYIGITGWLCDERRGELLQQAMQYLPLDRLILETDAPYLLPRNLVNKPKSRRNEPAFVSAIAEKIAELRGWSLTDIAKHSTQNANLLFRLEVD